MRGTGQRVTHAADSNEEGMCKPPEGASPTVKPKKPVSSVRHAIRVAAHEGVYHAYRNVTTLGSFWANPARAGALSPLLSTSRFNSPSDHRFPGLWSR